MIFDIETDGLDPTKIHVLSYFDGTDVKHVFDYDKMREVLMSADSLIGHNIIRYDLPALRNILGFRPNHVQKVVDTLALSWYINHERGKHNLDSYGEQYGIPKPVVEDWNSLTPEEYAHRCDEDVKINVRLYKELSYKMGKLYKDPKDLQKCTEYLTFKMQCAAEQERLGWRIDIDKARTHLAQLEQLKGEKVEQLKKSMPEQIVYGERKRPSQWLNKDGSLSSRAIGWQNLMDEMCLPYSTEKVKVEIRRIEANPNSITQVKSWLFGLGWEPKTFEYHRDKATGDERRIEQIRKDGELCESVTDLRDRDPAVDVLEGLTIINHRLGIFKSFVESENNGYVRATIAGFTNTLRFRHARPLVNLPAVDKPWGAEIRGCLIAPDGYVLCGADMVSLEDTTKRHYMKPHDPDYVEEMSRDGFDPHLDLARHAGKITQDDIDRHVSGEVSLKSLRKKYKVVNYSATYGVGSTKLSRTMGIPQSEAQSMLEAFWDRNWAIQTAADNCKVREVNGGTWLLNPVSGIYHSLRYEKDRFSTLNQSTGVWCFDNWVCTCREGGIRVVGQFHDEIIALVKKGDEKKTEDLMGYAISQTNAAVKLNVALGIDYSFGKNYSEIH